MGDAAEKLINYWRLLNFRIAPGAAEERVREFERVNKVILPADFRSYFLAVNGMLQVGGNDCDPNGFAFWPLTEVKSVREEYKKHSTHLPRVEDPDQHFVFVDYLQWCWAYAIRLTNDPSGPNSVVHVGTLQPKQVAASFTDFVDLYLRDANELYPLPPSSEPSSRHS